MKINQKKRIIGPVCMIGTKEYEKCVTEKRTYVKKNANFNSLSKPFDKLP